MIIIGADYHPGFQQIAFVDTETGELQERRLEHREEAEKFYRDLGAQGMRVLKTKIVSALATDGFGQDHCLPTSRHR